MISRAAFYPLKQFDYSGIDEYFPKTMLDASQAVLYMSGSIIIATIVNPYFLIPMLILGVFFVFVRKVFLKTSENIKRLEGASK